MELLPLTRRLEASLAVSVCGLFGLLARLRRGSPPAQEVVEGSSEHVLHLLIAELITVSLNLKRAFFLGIQVLDNFEILRAGRAF